MYAQPGRDALGARWPAALAAPRVQRRHVDLVRVGSALCPAARRSPSASR